MADVSQHIVPNTAEFCLLDCEKAFNGLTDQEKKYAHYIARASWYGGLIVLYQTSPESPGIYLLLTKLFRHENAQSLKKRALDSGVSEDDVTAFMMYCSAVITNTANYKSFGDTKVIPNLPKETFEKVLTCSEAYKKDPDGVKALWTQLSNAMYSLTARELQLGLGPEGTTCYFSANCTKEDADIVKDFLVKQDVPMWNTRCIKEDDGLYVIRIASVLTTQEDLPFLGEHTYTASDSKEYKFRIVRGEYSPILALVNEHLSKAKEFAANDNEKMMLEKYIESFRTGSTQAHKDGSRYWIKDKGPVVESYIGFIEVYRDPVNSRAEFEGFVAMVNKEMSAKFTSLVDNASEYLPLLPWSADFEKDAFLQPDFTSLDVLAFSGSGLPAGINIPNYDDIRQDDGFKNVSLGNVLSSGYKGDKSITFVSESDKEGLAQWKVPSFEVQVGLHELLGHGSGKLFVESADGTLNFDKDKVRCPLTGKAITTWYQASETFYSRFSTMASSYEECRAECVGLLLCLNRDVLRVFGFTSDEDIQKVIYYNWLIMVRAGLLSLEFYSPETNSWRQAHMQARYVILHVLLEAGQDLVTIKELTGSDGKPDLLVTLDSAKIESVGKKAIADFLLKLQVYKATADYDAGYALYQAKYSQMLDEGEMKFTEWRSIVLNRKVPRKMFVQPNTSIQDNEVVLRNYEATCYGCMQSLADRFQEDTTLESTLTEMWAADRRHWPLTGLLFD